MAQERCRGRSSGTRGTQQTRLVFHALAGCPRLTAPRAARLATFKPTPNTGLPAVTPASLATCPWSSGQALQVKPSTTQRPHNSAFYSSLAVGVTRPGERAGEDVGWAAATARGHREAGEQPADSGVADTRPAGEASSHSHCRRGPPTHGFVYKNSLVLEPKLEVPPRALSLKSHVVSDTWTPARPDGPCFPTTVP